MGKLELHTPMSSTLRKQQKPGRWLPYIFIAPLMLFILGLAFYPTALTFIESFYRVDPEIPPVTFTGLGNYTALFQNPQVIFATVNTGLYMLFGLVLTLVIAFIIALLLWEQFPGRGTILAIVILPWALPGIVEGIIWNWIYNPSFGVLNSFLKSLHFIHQYHLWIGAHHILTVFLIELVQVWQMTPLAVVLILSGLQTIPHELLEASTVDGAGSFHRLFRIIVPLVRPALAIAAVNVLILAFNIYDQVYALNGQASTGMSVMMQDYQIAFLNLNFGQGYALSFLVTIISAIISLGLLRAIYRRVEY
jgi:multiple sugar transport system permease protein